MKLTGKLVYEPERPGFKKINKLSTLLLEFPHNHLGISHYYMRLIEAQLGPWCNLAPPMFGMHITVVRGNGDRFDPELMQRVVGKSITVTLDPTTLQRTPWSGENAAFWYMDVISPELQELRQKLSVKPIFSFQPHLTVAREGPDFFMHIGQIVDPLALARKCFDVIPGRNDRLAGGNFELKDKLEAFIKAYHVDPMYTANHLVNLLYSYVRVPLKEWQVNLLQLLPRRM